MQRVTCKGREEPEGEVVPSGDDKVFTSLSLRFHDIQR